ncbi:hypothetical protein MFU01_70690 [Myxococcus fulvus]|uniref:Uncharacterized protein n=1 Tax=Myxococcus fulvus TaxID=33 RepID=A0A511TF66_MYXFU|nr:hypothetical protein MFU01_70690 [Myxococcus fulvus]
MKAGSQYGEASDDFPPHAHTAHAMMAHPRRHRLLNRRDMIPPEARAARPGGAHRTPRQVTITLTGAPHGMGEVASRARQFQTPHVLPIHHASAPARIRAEHLD